MKLNILFVTLISGLLSVTGAGAEDGFQGPEAVRYDPDQDIYFVANFNGARDGDANGFVSKMAPDGEILTLKFMVGTEKHPFHAGRGMYITGEGLWVADAKGIHLFDRKSGKQLDFVDLSQFDPGFPNDIVQAHDGDLYVTDTGKSSLYRIHNRTASLAATVPMKPNGITVHPETGQLLLAPWTGADEIVTWDVGTKSFGAAGKLTGEGKFDGIEVVGDSIILSSQSDTSLHVMTDGVDRKAYHLTGKPADIGIDTKRGNVAVPYVALNRVDIIPLSKLDK